MAKVVGVNPIKGTGKNGKEFDAVIVSMTRSHGERDNKAVGLYAFNVFVDREMFDSAARTVNGLPYEKVVGREIDIFRNERGFVESVRVK